MVERIQSPSHKKLMGDRGLEGHLRDQGHQFEQQEMVTKERLAKILNGAAKPCTVKCKLDGKPLEMPLTNENARHVYMNLARLINQGEVRGLEIKDAQ